jgi:ATP-dependent Clp protease ATP-binding subunit ClpB
MTSNIGSEYLIEGVTKDGEIREDARANVMGALRHHFMPEFLNRVDDIIMFKPLTLGEIKQIVDLLAEDLNRRLKTRRLTLRLTDQARDFIANAGYDPVYGARPLKRFMQREVETRIGRSIIAGSTLDGSTITIDVKDNELVVTPVREPEEVSAA